MARLFTQTLIRTTTSTPQSSNPLQPFKSAISQHHQFSSQSSKAQFFEVDLESDNDVEVLGLRKLEDAIHSIIVRQSAPDWLPFVPGSSYWVPPSRHRGNSQGIVDLLRKFNKPVTEGETVSVGLENGWPSSAYYIEGTSSMHPMPIEMEAEGVHSDKENTADAKNEEG